MVSMVYVLQSSVVFEHYFLYSKICLKSFSGDLEETVAELEMCRRKLAALRTQKETAVVAPSTTGATLGVKIEGSERVGGPEKISKENREFEAALEEAKVQTFLNFLLCF